MRHCGLGFALIAISTACAETPVASPRADELPKLLNIPAGAFVAGSDRAEREAAYALDAVAYGHDVTRTQGWYERERDRTTIASDAYRITRTPITNRQYRAFLAASDHPEPDVDLATWESYGLVHPYPRTRRHAWSNRLPPLGRDDHPVVLVSQIDANRYAQWLSRATGESWRLPSEIEWEKAARGVDGWRFPWGDEYRPEKLNSHDLGPFDTMPVGAFPGGLSPFGLLDAAGQVFEWTADSTNAGRAVVKGGSWDDKGCGVCRPAARHTRPVDIKHILIGFRLVRE